MDTSHSEKGPKVVTGFRDKRAKASNLSNTYDRAAFKWLSKAQNQSNEAPTSHNRAMNQWQCLAITCISLKAREKSRVHGAIGFGVAFHWLKNWRESFNPITRRSNRNHLITIDSHLNTALIVIIIIINICTAPIQIRFRFFTKLRTKSIIT